MVEATCPDCGSSHTRMDDLNPGYTYCQSCSSSSLVLRGPVSRFQQVILTIQPEALLASEELEKIRQFVLFCVEAKTGEADAGPEEQAYARLLLEER